MSEFSLNQEWSNRRGEEVTTFQPCGMIVFYSGTKCQEVSVTNQGDGNNYSWNCGKMFVSVRATRQDVENQYYGEGKYSADEDY